MHSLGVRNKYIMKTLFLVFISLLLLGCEHNPIIRTVYVDKVMVPSVSKEYLAKSMPPTPPNKTEYLDSTIDERESILTSYITSLLTFIKKQHNDKDAIQTQLDNFNKLYTTKPQDPSLKSNEQ